MRKGVCEFNSFKFCNNIYADRWAAKRKNVCRIDIQEFAFCHIKNREAKFIKCLSQFVIILLRSIYPNIHVPLNILAINRSISCLRNDFYPIWADQT